jgi:hypothetical protein
VPEEGAKRLLAEETLGPEELDVLFQKIEPENQEVSRTVSRQRAPFGRSAVGPQSEGPASVGREGEDPAAAA